MARLQLRYQEVKIERVAVAAAVVDVDKETGRHCEVRAGGTALGGTPVNIKRSSEVSAIKN
jgi:hypothetical protein